MGTKNLSKPAVMIVILLLLPKLVLASARLQDLPSSVPVKTEYYTIDELGPAKENGILRFKITSPHAVYDIEGFRPLVKVVGEIEVIEKIRRDKQGNGFFDGASASVQATADGLGNLVEHPVQSVKGVGKAAGKLGRSLGGVFKKKEEGEKSSFGEKMLGANERELAREFKVDVYTSNPHLKAMLRQMARSRMGGKGAVMVIKFLVPVAAVASIAMTAGGMNSAADQLVNNASRRDLYKQNKDAYVKMGLDEKTAKEILNVGYLSPREETYLRFYYEKLKDAENSGEIISSLKNAKTEWEVRRELYEMEMAAAAAEAAKAIKLKDTPEGLMVLDEKGRLTFYAAYDDLEGGDFESTVVGRADAWRKETQAREVEIQNVGYIAESFRKAAGKARMKSRGWACLKESEA